MSNPFASNRAYTALAGAISLTVASFGGGCASHRSESEQSSRPNVPIWTPELLSFAAERSRSEITSISLARDFSNLSTSSEQKEFLSKLDLISELQKMPNDKARETLRSLLVSGAKDTEVIRCINALPISELAERKILIEGDSTLGTITILAQTHESPIAPEAYSSDTCLSQRLIFSELYDRGYSIVLSEGLFGELNENLRMEVDADGSRRMANMAKILAEQPFDRYPHDLQTSITGVFRWLDGANAYGIANPEARIVPAFSSEFGGRIASAIDQMRSNFVDLHETVSADLTPFVMDAREAEVMKNALRYLSLYPGAHVAVVFGANHVFDAADFPPDTKFPRVERVDFPAVRAQQFWRSDNSIRACLTALGDSPERQVAFIDSLIPNQDAIGLMLFCMCGSD